MSTAESPSSPTERGSLRTRHFTDCLGVFQGGGCRTAAYAGAYREAHSAQVRFAGVAGTSAGAIVAALIATGAVPDQLDEALDRLQFLSFLQPRRPTFESPGCLGI